MTARRPGMKSNKPAGDRVRQPAKKQQKTKKPGPRRRVVNPHTPGRRALVISFSYLGFSWKTLSAFHLALPAVLFTRLSSNVKSSGLGPSSSAARRPTYDKQTWRIRFPVTCLFPGVFAAPCDNWHVPAGRCLCTRYSYFGEDCFAVRIPPPVLAANRKSPEPVFPFSPVVRSPSKNAGAQNAITQNSSARTMPAGALPALDSVAAYRHRAYGGRRGPIPAKVVAALAKSVVVIRPLAAAVVNGPAITARQDRPSPWARAIPIAVGLYQPGQTSIGGQNWVATDIVPDSQEMANVVQQCAISPRAARAFQLVRSAFGRKERPRKAGPFCRLRALARLATKPRPSSA